MLIPSFYTLNLFVHLLAVSLWLGVTLSFSIFMIPILRKLPEEQAEEHLEWLGQRARKLVVGLMVLLVGTGLVNVHRVGLMNFSEVWGTHYGITAGIKIALAVALFVAFPVIMVLVHRGERDDLNSRLRKMDYLHWGIVAITVIIMFLGVMLRT